MTPAKPDAALSEHHRFLRFRAWAEVGMAAVGALVCVVLFIVCLK